jgi:hypothetical protein
MPKRPARRPRILSIGLMVSTYAGHVYGVPVTAAPKTLTGVAACETAAQDMGFMQALLGYCAAGQERGFDLTSFQYRGIAQLRVLRTSKGPGLPPLQFD